MERNRVEYSRPCSGREKDRESTQRDYRLPEWSSLPAIKVESGRNLRCLDNEPRLNY